jgi:hypothetical protein
MRYLTKEATPMQKPQPDAICDERDEERVVAGARPAMSLGGGTQAYETQCEANHGRGAHATLPAIDLFA